MRNILKEMWHDIELTCLIFCFILFYFRSVFMYVIVYCTLFGNRLKQKKNTHIQIESSPYFFLIGCYVCFVVKLLDLRKKFKASTAGFFFLLLFQKRQ